MAQPGTLLKLIEQQAQKEELSPELIRELAREVGISTFALEAKLRSLGRTTPTECAHKPGFVSYGRIEFPDGLLQGSGLSAPATVRKDGWAAATLGDNRSERRVERDGLSSPRVDEADRADGEGSTESANKRIFRY